MWHVKYKNDLEINANSFEDQLRKFEASLNTILFFSFQNDQRFALVLLINK